MIINFLNFSLSGGAPFTNTPENPLTKQIISGAYSFSNHCWRNVSGEAKDLIKKLMTVDPNQRITVARALEHPWMKVKALFGVVLKHLKIVFTIL